MEKVLQERFGLNKKSKIVIAISVGLFFLFSIFIYSFLYEKIKAVVTEETEQNVVSINELNADIVDRELANRQNLLQSFADNLMEKKSDRYDIILREMHAYARNYDIHTLGILMPDGRLMTTDGKEFNTSLYRTPYTRALDGKPMISESFLAPGGSGERINLLSIPVSYEGELQFVLISAYLSSDLARLMKISALDGKVYSYILDEKGKMAIYPDSYDNSVYRSLIEYIDDEPGFIEGGEGFREFTFRGEEYYVYFSHLKINQWHLLTCSKKADVFSRAQLILSYVFAGFGLLWIQIHCFIILFFFLYYRFQKKTQAVVFYDKLLKEKNFEYLRVYFPQIPPEKKEKMALAVFDINKFKEFNVVYGIHAGDLVLKYINRVFKEELPDDEIFRYQADIFIGLMSCEDKKEAENKVRKILNRFSRDIERNRVQSFDMSVGIRLIKQKDVLRVVYSDAVTAKNEVKGNHFQKFAFYDDYMRKERLEYMEMEADFHKAVREDEFHVFYQPKVDMRTGKIVGAEALARWFKSDGSVISPAVFIPCFEKNRQIIVLDEIMMKNVCRQMRSMQEEGLEVPPVSVNLSRVHLKHSGIAGKIKNILLETEIDPAKLEFEVTESALYEDSIPLHEIIEQLHRMGCKVNMDDYGKGVSGVSSLAENAFDVIKLDKSFINGIGNHKMEAVIRSTISLAAELNMKILAEGVENQQQAEKLVQWGCYYAQGFFYSKPVSQEEYRKMLAKKA